MSSAAGFAVTLIVKNTGDMNAYAGHLLHPGTVL